MFQKIKPTKLFTVTATIVCSGRTSSSSSLLTSGISVFSGSRHQNPRLQSVVLSSFPMPHTHTHTHTLVPAASSSRYVATYSAVLSLHTAPQGWKGGMRREGVATVYNSSTPAAQGGSSIRSIVLLSMHAQWYRSNAKFPIVSASLSPKPPPRGAGHAHQS